MIKAIKSAGYLRARKKLQLWQTGAKDIRQQGYACGCCRSSHYLSYTLDGLNDPPPLDETLEYCATYCGACGFTGACARKRA